MASAGQRVPTSHLSVSRGAPCEEMVGWLTAESSLALLTATRPLALHHGAGMEMHQHVSIEVASWNTSGVKNK